MEHERRWMIRVDDESEFVYDPENRSTTAIFLSIIKRHTWLHVPNRSTRDVGRASAQHTRKIFRSSLVRSKRLPRIWNLISLIHAPGQQNQITRSTIVLIRDLRHMHNTNRANGVCVTTMNATHNPTHPFSRLQCIRFLV